MRLISVSSTERHDLLTEIGGNFKAPKFLLGRLQTTGQRARFKLGIVFNTPNGQLVITRTLKERIMWQLQSEPSHRLGDLRHKRENYFRSWLTHERPSLCYKLGAHLVAVLVFDSYEPAR